VTPLTTLRLAEENVRVELAKVREQLKNTDAIALAGEQAKSELDAMTERRKVGGQRHYRDPADEVAAGLRMRVEAAAHVSALQGRLRAEEAYLLVELERTRRDVEARGVRQSLLPMLEHVGDAPLCPMRWDQMEGTGDARRCSRCKHEVYNIAMVEADQAEALLARHGRNRLRRRIDGTLVAGDCPRSINVAVVVGIVCALAAAMGVVYRLAFH
jgi:hypothetical protein